MSCTTVSARGCSYCYAPYDSEKGRYSVLVKKESSETHIVEEVCCETCLVRVCDAVKNQFPIPPLETDTFLTDRVDTDFNLDWHLFAASPLEIGLYRCRSISELGLLLSTPDVSELNLYKAVIEEVVFRNPSEQIPLNMWISALNRVLPASADQGSFGVSQDDDGVITSIFHGDVEKLELLMSAIGQCGIVLSEKVWAEALLKAAPHCIQMTPIQPGSYQSVMSRGVLYDKKYSQGDSRIVGVLFSAMTKTGLISASEVVFESFKNAENKIRKDVFFIFIAVMPDEPIVDFLIKLCFCEETDPCLFFFAEGLDRLLRIKTESNLKLIISRFLSKFKEFLQKATPSFDELRGKAIVDIVSKIEPIVMVI